MDNAPQEIQCFEDYLNKAGWGLYHHFAVLLACSCNFVQATTFITIPMAIALSTCKESVIPEYIGLRILTTFYLGSCFGGLIANFLSDRYGRKRYLSCSLIFMFMSIFIAAFAFNAYVIMIASLFLGVGMETNVASVKLLLIEILPREKRGIYMVYCNIYWCLGYIFTTVLTILLETPFLSNTAKIPDPNLTTWRVMFAICGGANLLLACACALIEESPRYFLQMGRSYMAYLVLKQLYAINTSDFAENFKVKEDEIKTLIPACGLFYLEPEQYWDIFKKLTWRFCQSLKLMFSKRFRKTTCILIVMKILLIVVGVLQLNVILAKKVSSSLIPSVTSNKYRGLDFIYPVFRPLSYMSPRELNASTSICDVNEHNRIFYRHFMIVGSAPFLGLLISMLFVDKLGRRSVLFTGSVLSGSSFILLKFIKETRIQLILSCIILASVSSVISIVSLVSLEAYPSAIRGTSYGVTNFIGLFLTVIFINCIAIESTIFTAVMGALYVCMSVSSLFLPELKRKPMIE